MSSQTSLLAAKVFLNRRQDRISCFNSPRLSRIIQDLREDPEAREQLD